MNSYRATTQNNLRQLSLFAAHHANADPKKDDPTKIPREIPAGTIVLSGIPPENRLSWFVYVLPDLDQRRQDVVGLMTQINQAEPWSAARNQEAARTRLAVALSPLDTPITASDQPAVTCYVGIAGIGPDAATLAPPPSTRPRATGGSIPLRRGHAIRSHRRWIGPDAATGRNGQRPRPLAARRAEHGCAEWTMERRKAAHWRGWAVRRLLSERCVFRDVRWIGAKHHATSLARRVAQSGDDRWRS